MAFGSTNLAATPCCGLITRSWECFQDRDSPTGHVHSPGSGEQGEYTPDFEEENILLFRGICPDCGQSFETWLFDVGAQITPQGWQWDYRKALASFQMVQKTVRLK